MELQKKIICLELAGSLWELPFVCKNWFDEWNWLCVPPIMGWSLILLLRMHVQCESISRSSRFKPWGTDVRSKCMNLFSTLFLIIKACGLLGAFLWTLGCVLLCHSFHVFWKRNVVLEFSLCLPEQYLSGVLKSCFNSH